MRQIARDLARRLAAAGVDARALAALVNEMATARAEAINREGLQAQTAYLLQAYGPGESKASLWAIGRDRTSREQDHRLRPGEPGDVGRAGGPASCSPTTRSPTARGSPPSALSWRLGRRSKPH